MKGIRRALISVSDKTGLEKLAQVLSAHQIEIVSTGGTSASLRKFGIKVTDVSSVTQFPEILDGRVKTLHPSIHGGILANQDKPEHCKQLNNLDIQPFDLVIVNLYPFRNTLANNPDNHDLIIENIDIGGPCLIRASAKNYRHCLIITDPEDYDFLGDLIKNNLPITDLKRKELAFKAFSHTCKYDYFIQSWLKYSLNTVSDSLPDELLYLFEREEILRYGENPHQKAAVYRMSDQSNTGLLGYQQHSGKKLSFNNMLDLNAAWEIVTAFDAPAVSVIKHQNPCGAAQANTLTKACENALEGDPQSAFGGIVALNKPVDSKTAAKLHKTHLLEVLAPPGYSTEALTILRRKKNRRLIELQKNVPGKDQLDIRFFHNGALIQTRDNSVDSQKQFTVVTECSPTSSQWEDLIFGWQICRFVKSNAIVFARNQMITGVGAGQMSRVDSVIIAANKAGTRAHDGVMASDAFFPFRDGIDSAVSAGIRAIIQPGGSKGDQDVIAACNELKIAMVFTGIRHFRH
ncbi:bifunctional phosphoribosylaminoimidazolecarboxamide formyltransferase/IMP cyclohydrolase [bacterium]|nr:bifunctional phosphoribosylaminoimidazolecarboxamide formyltransferase/IMP cyclohydrolase [bacterium]